MIKILLECPETIESVVSYSEALVLLDNLVYLGEISSEDSHILKWTNWKQLKTELSQVFFQVDWSSFQYLFFAFKFFEINFVPN